MYFYVFHCAHVQECSTQDMKMGKVGVSGKASLNTTLELFSTNQMSVLTDDYRYVTTKASLPSSLNNISLCVCVCVCVCDSILGRSSIGDL